MKNIHINWKNIFFTSILVFLLINAFSKSAPVQPINETKNMASKLKPYIGMGISISSYHSGKMICQRDIHKSVLKEVGEDYILVNWAGRDEIYPFYNLYRVFQHENYLMVYLQ